MTLNVWIRHCNCHTLQLKAASPGAGRVLGAIHFDARHDIVEPLLNGVAVLVVDDDDDARELNALVLSAAGALVSTAASASEALRRFGEHWDIVVTDIWMPGSSGYDLLHDARRQGYRVPIIALTALDPPEHRTRATASGFAGFLTKPLDPDCLIRAVLDAIAGRAQNEAESDLPARAAWRAPEAR